MPFKVMHRKEVTLSNGSYVRKSRGRKLADEMGQGGAREPRWSLGSREDADKMQ